MLKLKSTGAINVCQVALDIIQHVSFRLHMSVINESNKMSVELSYGTL